MRTSYIPPRTKNVSVSFKDPVIALLEAEANATGSYVSSVIRKAVLEHLGVDKWGNSVGVKK